MKVLQATVSFQSGWEFKLEKVFHEDWPDLNKAEQEVRDDLIYLIRDKKLLSISISEPE